MMVCMPEFGVFNEFRRFSPLEGICVVEIVTTWVNWLKRHIVSNRIIISHGQIVWKAGIRLFDYFAYVKAIFSVSYNREAIL